MLRKTPRRSETNITYKDLDITQFPILNPEHVQKITTAFYLGDGGMPIEDLEEFISNYRAFYCSVDIPREKLRMVPEKEETMNANEDMEDE